MSYYNSKIDHINLTVPNIEKAEEFYTKVLGFEVTGRFESNTKFVFITDGSATYELMQDSSIDKTVIDHIAYVSNDIKADFEHFNALGLTITELGFADFLFENGMYYFFIKGSNGERIEFCQRKGE